MAIPGLEALDNRLLDGLVFCATAYRLLDAIRSEPRGIAELRLRRSPRAKKLLVEILPLAAFAGNLNTLQRLNTEFCDALRTQSLGTVTEKNAAAYGEAIAGKGLAYVLAYHQATHLAMHTGQIRTIRNLYRKTRGEPARFFPDNPTYSGGLE